jgi:hypothetical protein
MPAPAYVKTWQHSPNFLATRTTTLNGAQKIWFQVKGALTGFGTLPWTVQFSCNGQGGAGSFGASDKWLASTDLVWAASGSNHSWIVLRQTGVAAKFEVCIDLNSSSAFNISFIYSPVNGFGAANGGADGTATARPTASDEVVVRSIYQWTWNDADQPVQVHVQQSTDGQCTRAVFCGSNGAQTILILDRVQNALSAWSGTKAVVLFIGSNAPGTQVGTYANLNDVASLNFKHGSTAGTAFMAALGYVASANGEQLLAQNDLSKEYAFDDISVWSETASLRGLWGTMFDMYLGPTAGPVNATMEDSAGSPLGWVQFGHLILPWASGNGVPRFA